MKNKKENVRYGKINKNYEKRKHRRVWVKGYYRKVKIKVEGKEKVVRKWIEPHWRKIKQKSFWDKW